MASNQVFVFLAIIAVALPTIAMATEYVVGDAKGWTVDFDYTEWTKDKVFWVGDKLVFNYNPMNHNVFKVNGTAFKDCVVPPPSDAFTSGNDIITLGTPGNKWYICGKQGHCANRKQKLTINVMAVGAPAPAPSAANGLVISAYQIVMAAMAAVAMIFV